MADHEFAGTLSVTDKIGIGIEEPIAQLHIASSTPAPSQTFLESGGALLKLSVDASGAAIGTDNAFPLSIQTDGSPRISINNAGNVTISEALSVQKSLAVSGNVGIGTISPSYKLAIAAGDINIDDSRALRQAGRWVIGGDSKVLSIGSSNKVDARDISFDPGFAGALTIKKDTGNVGIGTTNPKAKLDVAGNINTTGIISGSHLPPNLIRNSYMNILDGTKPAGYSVLGNITLEAVHPYTKGFEGPYWQPPANPASSVDTATEATPYYFGQYNKGSRASRGGLADGWHSFSDGRILKITGNNSGEHTCVFFPFEQNVLTNKVHFKAWLKIASGSKVGLGADSGYQNVVRGLIITKDQTNAAPDGWHQIDAVIDISEMTSLDGLAFSIGIEASGTFEVYLALPYLANLDNDTWLPSVSDMLSRDGLTVHPSSGNVGIGTTTPTHKFHVLAADAVGLLESTGSQAYLRLSTTEGLDNRVEITNRPGGRLSLWTAGTGDAFNITRAGNVGIGTTTPTHKFHVLAADAVGLLESTGSQAYLRLSTTEGLDNRVEITNRPGGRLSLWTAGAGDAFNITKTGNVGIGTTTPAYKLDITGAAHASSFPTSSDVRLKKDVTQLTNVLEKLEKIRGVAFEWNELYESLGRSTGHREIGVTAQEVEAVFPELVTTWGDEGYKAVDYGRLTGVLIEAVKELKAENEALKQRIKALEKVIENK